MGVSIAIILLLQVTEASTELIQATLKVGVDEKCIGGFYDVTRTWDEHIEDLEAGVIGDMGLWL